MRKELALVATELGVREAKLIQYLNEAYGKEKQLESALQAHIKMTPTGAITLAVIVLFAALFAAAAVGALLEVF